MTSWRNTPDNIFLQAHINHMKKICGKEMNNILSTARVLRIQAMYERNPELVADLEEEIAKLVGANCYD